MRFRRSRGRREPLTWSRVAFSSSFGGASTNLVSTLPAAAPFAGVILFDPSVTQATILADYRVSLRRLRVTRQISMAQNVATSAGTVNEIQMVAVTIKTSKLPADFVTGVVTLNTLLETEDVMHMWQGQYIIGAGAYQGFQSPSGDFIPWDIVAQRKLNATELVLQLYYLAWIGPSAPSGTSPVTTFRVNGVVSALWQRTLR